MTALETIGLPLAAIGGGALAGTAIACLPGFHIYSLLGVALLAFAGPDGVAGGPALAFAVAAVTAWAIVSAVPAVLLSAPDESAVFAVLPGQRYLLDGRGLEAVHLTALGSALALAVLLPIGGLLARAIPTVHRVLAPHYHWILWVVLTFMVLSEWPQGRIAGLAPGQRLWSGLRNVLAGLATFVLAGLLGIILFERTPLTPVHAAQGLMPAFAGLFAVPWLLLNALSRVRLPAQRQAAGRLPPAPELLQGLAAGLAGGAFAAFIPVVSGGVGGLLAGHALSTRNERSFLLSQGACRIVYYAGGLLLLFVPAASLARGSAAAMLRVAHVPGPGDLSLALAATALSAGLALLLVRPAARMVLWLLGRFGYAPVSLVSLTLLSGLVASMGGLAGLGIMGVATGIGLIPPLYGARRLNALAVILVPMACAMSGWMPAIARCLGLGPA